MNCDGTMPDRSKDMMQRSTIGVGIIGASPDKGGWAAARAECAKVQRALVDHRAQHGC